MVAPAYYSADDVAAILGLHVRTVRNYVRDGRLPAVKIGKQYRISPEDVEMLTGGRSGGTPGAPRRDIQVEATAIVQVTGIDDVTMARISTLVIGAVSNRPRDTVPLRVETWHDPPQRSAKVVAIGSTDDVAAVVGLIGTFIEAAL